MSAAAVANQPEAVAALEICGLVKDFSVGLRGVKLRAVDHLDLRVEPGQVYGLLGPNGSGKSTTIKLILGLLRPSAGECRIFGVSSRRVEARCEVGYLPEAPQFQRHLTGRELIRFHGRLCGLSGPALADRVQEVLELTGMSAAAERRVGTYSKGMLQRIGFAQAIVHDPRLLILDEPTAGVDVAGVEALVALLGRLKAGGKTVLFTSHLHGEVEELCDRVALLERGRRVLEGAVAELTGRNENARQAFVVPPLPPAEMEHLRAWLGERGRALEWVEPPRPRLERVVRERLRQNPEECDS